MKIKRSELKNIIKKALIQEVASFRGGKLDKIESIIKQIKEEEVSDEWQDFDSFEFSTSAKKAAEEDIEDEFGEKVPELGTQEDKDKFISDLERANLKLPSDEEEIEKIRQTLIQKKKEKDSMRGFSLNENFDNKILKEESENNYMSPQNLKAIISSADYLLSKIDADSDIEDWVEDKISKTAENMRSLMNFYKYGRASEKIEEKIEKIKERIQEIDEKINLLEQSGDQIINQLDLDKGDVYDSKDLGDMVDKISQDNEAYDYLKDEADELFDDYLNNGGGNEKVSKEISIPIFPDEKSTPEDIVYDHMMNYLISKEWYEDYSSHDVDIIKGILRDNIKSLLNKLLKEFDYASIERDYQDMEYMSEEESEAEELFKKSIGDSYWDEAKEKYPEYNSLEAQKESAVKYIISAMKDKYPEKKWIDIEADIRDKVEDSLS